IRAQPKLPALPLAQPAWLPDREVPQGLAGRVFTGRLANDQQYSDRPGARVHMPLAPRPVEEGRREARDKYPISMRITPFSDPSTGHTFYAGYFFVANGSTFS